MDAPACDVRLAPALPAIKPMARFGEFSGSAMHTTGWAYSDNGGASVVQPNSNPADSALLPTVPNGTQTTSDDANHSLAWGNANARLYMASTSWPNQGDINVYARPAVGARSS